MNWRSSLPAVCAGFLMLTPAAHAGEKTLMHCFAWTSIKDAGQADWTAFFKASDALPSKIKGITRVWYGKLAAPLSQYNVQAQGDAQQKLRSGEATPVTAQRVPRDWGMCMEMAGPDTLKAYDADPYHKTWTDAYAKIRVEGTTTFNILGQ
jgi:hypothetical protein